MPSASLRHLVLVLGDQLDLQSAALDDFDPKRDAVWMVEVARESEKVWSHKARITLFLAAMRHFRDALLRRQWRVFYRELDDAGNTGTFGGELRRTVKESRPEKIVVVEPGEWSVREKLLAAAKAARVPAEIRPDRRYFCSTEEFARHASGRKQLRMEYFYREMRQKTGVLMDGRQPVGGQWNYDHDNRGSFDTHGPGLHPAPLRFTPDATTREVIALVEKHFPLHPGNLARFDWPVTPEEADAALEDFIVNRLPDFGRWQDAMWTDEPWLYHSRLSSAMNLGLLDPRKVVAAAENAWLEKKATLASVEGFIRQVLGWREYVRGVYWLHMPEYIGRNALHAERPLPGFYWTAETEMNCLRQAIGQTLEYGYAHHIQRLMVTGLFALLLGVKPQAVHQWYLAVYVDAVEWVELPNTLGMSQYGDGGLMGSKPYVATGKYIDRMSNYCAGCKFKPGERVGPAACPFTTLYWDFLLQHEKRLGENQRMSMQLRNLLRFTPDEKAAIIRQAAKVRRACPPA